MRSVSELLVKNLSYEERKAIYDYSQFSSDIEKREFYGLLRIIEQLTRVNLTSSGCDFNSINILGLENCCNYFKVLCEQFSKFKVLENSNCIIRPVEFDIIIENIKANNKKRVLSVNLYDDSKNIEKIVSDNFEKLKSKMNKDLDDWYMYKLAILATFAHAYYELRDLLEGKSYFDAEFLTEYRELPKEYAELSFQLLYRASRLRGETISDTRENLLEILNKGMDVLERTPIKINNFKNIESKK